MDPNKKPKDGFAGLIENWQTDALSGFLVFILAVPLSMGIAQASDFQPIYGLLTAMIGGLVVAFISGSLLTIKGPAAGLIVIVASAVSDFGGHETGWKLALGAIVVAGVLQVVFGLLKFGRLSDFFPLSAVHGMLAAIGLIIIFKQLHGILGQNPVLGWVEPDLTGEEALKPLVEPLDLLRTLAHSIANLDQSALIIGLSSLVIIFTWPLIKNKFLKKIPAPLVVLLVAIPLASVVGLNAKYFVHFDKGLADILEVNADFSGIEMVGTFIKYVIMFALVGSLEALLTVKAIDMRDVFRRKSNTNKELVAIGAGNILAGLLGGLPMISEVARSSANVANGARTRWANFFHGVFIFLFLLFAMSFSDLIPKPALSALLIGVGWKLAHPREFKHMIHIGRDQFLIFICTIVVTLASDLLIGIFCGIALKIFFQLFRGLKTKDMFKLRTTKIENGDNVTLIANSSLVFSNYIPLIAELYKLPAGKTVNLDIKNCDVVDHSTMENLHHFEQDYNRAGGKFHIDGLDAFIQMSPYKFSDRYNKKLQNKKALES